MLIPRGVVAENGQGGSFDLQVICKDGTTDKSFQNIQKVLVQVDTGGNGSGSLASHTVTTTIPWTGVYTTTYYTTGTDSTVTEVIEVPSSSCPAYATTTTTWTGAYTTSYLTTGTDSSVTQVIEVPPKSSASSAHGQATSITSALPIGHTTTFTNTNGVTQTGLVSVFTSTNSDGSIVTLTTTECFCTREKTSEYVTTVTNTRGAVETLTITIPCVTSTYIDANGKTKTEVVSGVVTTDTAGSVIVSSATSEVQVTTLTKTNGTVETVTVTVPCESTTVLTRINAAGKTTITATVTYFATTNAEGSVKTTGAVIYSTTVSGNSGVVTSVISEALPEQKSTVIYTSGQSARTGVVIVETLSVSHDTTIMATTMSVLLGTDSTLFTSVGTGIPQVTSLYEGGGSKLSSAGVLVSLLSIILAALF